MLYVFQSIFTSLLVTYDNCVGKESAYNARDHLQYRRPGLERSPFEGNGNSLQYSCLENSMSRGASWATVHGFSRVGHNLVTEPPPLCEWGRQVWEYSWTKVNLTYAVVSLQRYLASLAMSYQKVEYSLFQMFILRGEAVWWSDESTSFVTEVCVFNLDSAAWLILKPWFLHCNQGNSTKPREGL